MRHFFVVLAALLAVSVCCGAVDHNPTADVTPSVRRPDTAPHDMAQPAAAARRRATAKRVGAALAAVTSGADDCPRQTVLWEGSCRDPREQGACVYCPTGSTKGSDGLCSCAEGASYFPTFVAGCQAKIQRITPPPTITYLTSSIGSRITASDGQSAAIPLFTLQMPFALTMDNYAYITVTMQCSAGRTTLDVKVADDRHADCGATVPYQRVQERTGPMVAGIQSVQAQTYSSQLTVLLGTTEGIGHRICSFSARIRDIHAQDSKEKQVGWWTIVPPTSGSSSHRSGSGRGATSSSAASSSSRYASSSSRSQDESLSSLSSSASGAEVTVVTLSLGGRRSLIVFGALDCLMMAVVCVLHFIYRHEPQKLDRLKRGSQPHMPHHEPVTPARSVQVA